MYKRKHFPYMTMYLYTKWKRFMYTYYYYCVLFHIFTYIGPSICKDVPDIFFQKIYKQNTNIWTVKFAIQDFVIEYKMETFYVHLLLLLYSLSYLHMPTGAKFNASTTFLYDKNISILFFVLLYSQRIVERLCPYKNEESKDTSLNNMIHRKKERTYHKTYILWWVLVENNRWKFLILHLLK